MLNIVVVAMLSVQAVVGSIQGAAQQSKGETLVALGLDKRISLDLTNVPLAKAIDEITSKGNIEITYAPDVVQRAPRVTISNKSITVRDALGKVLNNTGLAMTTYGGKPAIIERRNARGIGQGVISGTVTDSKTGKGISGASVSIGSDMRDVTTGQDGAYRLTGVQAGTYTVSVRIVGYAKQTRTVAVGDGASAIVDFKLEPSANVLDQVIVTGTVVQTELKAVPNAITVITAKQIEERGITKIDQLFRGDVPGLFAQNLGSVSMLDEVSMFSRGATALSDVSAGLSKAPGQTFLTNPIKTYIDGVELADSKYLSQIDPRSIERIEILTGPQASTIYGSNAINGVMQIFTKRGSTSRPQLNLSLLSGWVQNNYSNAKTPQHDYSAQASGIEGRLSYNAGGSWNYMGPWTPAKQLTRTGGFGGARLDLPTPAGRVTADMTLRRSKTQSRQRGSEYQPLTGHEETGRWNVSSGSGLSVPKMHTLTGQTLGLVLGYAPTNWWSHELGVGQDVSDTEQRYTARGYQAEYDTTLYLSQNHANRRSLRYSTTARIPVTSLAQAMVTAGADAWQNLTSSWSVQPQTLTGPLTGSTSVSRQPGHNSGGFLQSQLAINDRLFLTYGLRAEWNPDYGEEAQPNYAPKYGIAYTQELGSLTAKLRGSYGRSTRPPSPRLKKNISVADWCTACGPFYIPIYGNFDWYLGNPELGPEHQQGGEGGMELYLGTRGSLVVTRYNQTVEGLIALTGSVDSVRSLVPTTVGQSPDADGFRYFRQSQYLNIGAIRNQGWELQGSMIVGPITTRGTYSWTKSRTIGVNPKYRAFFTPTNYPQYQPGATFRYLAEHTWAFGVTYARASSSVGLNLTGIGQVMIERDDLYFQNLDFRIRLPQNRRNVSNTGYVGVNSGYVLADLTASHRFLPRVEGVLQVQNLADLYINDWTGGAASLGRQLKAGIRWR